MSSKIRAAHGQAGIGLIDVMIGLTILAFVTTTLLGIFLSGMAQARVSGLRGEATACTAAGRR